MSGKGSGANPLAALLDTDLDDLWGNRGLTEAPTKGSKSRKAVAESAEDSQADAEASFLPKNMFSVSQPIDSLGFEVALVITSKEFLLTVRNLLYID